MPRIDDPAYLRHDQYRTSGNLQARIDFHVRFRTNPYDWQLWVFDRLRLMSLPPERKAAFARFAEEELARLGGMLRVSKDYGLFEAVRPA
jgi:hypothetical protein